MIGQKLLIGHLEYMIRRNEFPHFNIIIGEQGSGKKTLVRYIIDKLRCLAYYLPDNKIDTIRTAINDMYKISAPTVFVLTDVDDMSVQAKNVLLKVTEECPENVYIIMTVCDSNNILNTILSRATIHHIEPYTRSDILEYAISKQEDFDPEIVTDVCKVPGDVDKLFMMGADEFYNYVEKVVDNIAYVSVANVFKLTNKIALKPGADGYDLKLFLIAFERVCSKYMGQNVDDVEERTYWIEAMKVASNTLSALNSITGINKSALLDVFILNIRKVWS